MFIGRFRAFDMLASRAYAELMAKTRLAEQAISVFFGCVAATAAAYATMAATRVEFQFEAAGPEAVDSRIAQKASGVSITRARGYFFVVSRFAHALSARVRPSRRERRFYQGRKCAFLAANPLSERGIRDSWRRWFAEQCAAECLPRGDSESR